MKSFAQIDIENEGKYLKLLASISKLSGLFSESLTPLINYRVVENIFCKSFEAKNLSRSDTAFDANYKSIGVGLKTFICKNDSSIEKIAEFNQLSKVLKLFQGKDLAVKLSEFRNERINLANRVYDVESSLYHIVARREKELILFETDYDLINIDKIHSVNQTSKSIRFEDGNNVYSYNFSKSTLYRKFIIPKDYYRLPIDILEDPFSILLEIFAENNSDLKVKNKPIKGLDFVVLPLYSMRNGNKFIYEKSGLNQWNAGGRKRDKGEVYIKIPQIIHQLYPSFFPKRDVKFELENPTGEVYFAKLCQDNSKALMTDPNKHLSDWLLRKVLYLEEGELATIEKLNELGFDSVIIYKISNNRYKIDIMKTNSFERFLCK